MSFSVYEDYKDSGIEWIKDIPIDWETHRIKDFLSFKIGGTPSTSIESYFEGDNIWVSIADLSSNVGDYIFDSSVKISDDAIKVSNVKKISKDSLLYSFKLSVGLTAFAGCELYTNEAIASFEPNNYVDLNFLKYVFQAGFENNAMENIYGAKLFNTDLIKFARFVMPIDKEEQIKIAKFLDNKTSKINENIGRNKELISFLEEKKTALINQVVTKGLDPKVPMKDSGIEWIGEIPEHWEIKRLKYNCKVNPSDKKMVSDSNLKINFLPMEKVLEDGWYDSNSKEVYSKISKGYTYFEDHDVLVAKITPCFENGKSALVENLDYGFGFGSTEFHVIRFTEKILPKFIYYLIKTYSFRHIGQAFMTGTAGQKRVSTDFVENFPMVTPNINEQYAIVLYLDMEVSKIDKTISKIVENIDLLQEYKTSLIHHVVTGKIDVRDEI